MLTYQICFHFFPTNKVWISGQYAVQLVRAKTLIVSYAIYQTGFSLRGKCNLLHLASHFIPNIFSKSLKLKEEFT